MHRQHSTAKSGTHGAGLAIGSDIGNMPAMASFVLGQPLNDVNRQRKDRLRTVTELFPSIMDTTLGEGSTASCSAAEAPGNGTTPSSTTYSHSALS